MDNNPTMLVILDGFGYRQQPKGNAIFHAHKPTLDFLLKTYPHILVQASGTAVGLPENSPGNSEVGHLTLGAGRIIKQPLTIINDAIKNETLAQNAVLQSCFTQLKAQGGALHLMGLASNGTVHSSIDHLFAYLKIAQSYNFSKIYIHCFLDGRDVSPQSAATYLNELDQVIKTLGCGAIASLHGRFYAMDRDSNWLRTQNCYEVLTKRQEVTFDSWQKVLAYYYRQDLYDEFIPSTQLIPEGIINNGDGVLFFNVRPDRARQITQAFVDPHFKEFERTFITLSFFITPVSFGDTLPTSVLLPTKPVTPTLLECLSAARKSIFAIAETEKYAHISYFFNGGSEKPVAHETRVVIPSLPLRNYIQFPEMSAQKITEALLKTLDKPYDFYLVNYANADMVGHSGNYDATIRAVECLDEQLGVLYKEFVEKHNGTLYITADHGNAEMKIDPVTGLPSKSHTKNPVYFMMIKKGLENKPLAYHLNGLSDVAPFILKQMHILIPIQMNKV